MPGIRALDDHGSGYDEGFERPRVPRPHRAALVKALEGLSPSDVAAGVRRSAVAALGWQPRSESKSWTAVESTLVGMPQRFSDPVGATDACTPIEEVIALGAGVCQGFARLFLRLLRGWGWRGRSVSGYFFTGSPAREPMEPWTRRNTISVKGE